MKKILYSITIMVCLFTGNNLIQAQLVTPDHKKYSTSDPISTYETQKLFTFLQQSAKEKIIIGHQDDLAYGYGWRYGGYNPNQYTSDIFNACGDYPGLFGWDLGQLENTISNKQVNYVMNGIIISDLKKWINWVDEKGGINYFTWHANNPITNGNSWDNGDGTVVCKILTEGSAENTKFKAYLDVVSSFFASLKNKQGKAIPVLFRPYHEANLQNCFWWNYYDGNQCQHNMYKALWKYTHHYLTQVKNNHNILFVFSLNDNCMGYHKPEATFKINEDYPGDEYVDVIGYDLYMKNEFLQQNNLATLAVHAQSHNAFITEFAALHHKVAGITEAGWENYPSMDNPFTGIMENTFNPYPYSFILLWRNPDQINDKTSYYAVYPNHPNATDFKLFYHTTKRFMFLNETSNKRKQMLFKK